MLEKISAAVEDYYSKWEQLVSERSNKTYFKSLKPVAVGWKVEDRAEYDRLYAELHERCDKIVETWMNGRWVAKMHLKDDQLAKGIRIIKLMQRRPGSEDATGLDHLDFYSRTESIEAVLNEEHGLEWRREGNDAVEGYEWLSIWFAGTEAKLKASTVIDIVVHELQEINRQIIDGA